MLKCPRCRASLDSSTTIIRCDSCGQEYPRLGEIPVILKNPATYRLSCRQQFGAVEQRAAGAIQALESQMKLPGLLPSTRARCAASIQAIRDQAHEIHTILAPVLGEPEPAESSNELPAPLLYIHCLFRDWGWPAETGGENEQALATIEAVAGEQLLGRTLVLGAGGCRLAYDLHRRHNNEETTVIDIDPFLFAVAQTVIRGGEVTLHEANAEIDSTADATRAWILKARAGAIDPTGFRFLIADGRQPPFADASFDTIVTPWFIDVVPSDLRDLISEIHRLLKPGGRWFNSGPLHYRPETPATRRFTREEIFDLIGRAGLSVDRWQAQSVPYLVSKLNGRGKIERVLTFAATKTIARDIKTGPPSWLLFRHLPIPQFPGQPLLVTTDPTNQIVIGAIDGTNALDNIAAILGDRARDSGFSPDQLREIVRRSLVEIHPDCAGS